VIKVTNERKYYSSFEPLFRTASLGTVGWLIAELISRPHRFLIILFIATPIVLSFQAALLLATIRLFPVKIGPEGIRSYTAYGNYQTIIWQDFKHLKPFSILGLRYISIKNTRSKSIHIPLFLSGMNRFLEDVRTLAGAEHMLVQALSKELHPSNGDKQLEAT